MATRPPAGIVPTSEDDDAGEVTNRCLQQLQGPTPSASLETRPLENNDLLAQILLRLPALPSSLLRASVVCKGWHGVVTDPHFLRAFRAHHRKPPVLGFFPHDFLGFLPLDSGGRLEFTSVLNPPDQIPASRFSLQVTRTCKFLRSHHGRVLIADLRQKHFLVWDPVTGELRKVAFPEIPSPMASGHLIVMDGGVLCTSTNQGHVHGACHSDPFKLVFVAQDRKRYFGCVYSSETGAWGELFSITRQPMMMMTSPACPSTLSKNSMCLLLIGQKTVVLEFDWGRKNLALVDLPLPLDAPPGDECQLLMAPADSGGFSFIVLKVFTLRVWQRISNNGVGDARWLLANTIELRNNLSLGSAVTPVPLRILGLDEDGNVMFRLTNSETVFVVNLESMMFKRLPKKLAHIDIHSQPFSSFYTPGMYVSTGRNDLVHSSGGA